MFLNSPKPDKAYRDRIFNLQQDQIEANRIKRLQEVTFILIIYI